jgi:FkbM family methyltransferase
LPHNATFIDLGANIGSISVPICKLRPDIKAYAIEASSQIATYLKWNLENNAIENCIIEQKAIWKDEGLEFSFITPTEQYGKGMIDLECNKQHNEMVSTISISSLIAKYKIEKIDFIKVDIEGFEYFAFRGGEKILKDMNAPDILFEFIKEAEDGAKDLEPGDAQSILISYGYKLFKLEDNQLLPLDKPMHDGFAMIYATKKK